MGGGESLVEIEGGIGHLEVQKSRGVGEGVNGSGIIDHLKPQRIVPIRHVLGLLGLGQHGLAVGPLHAVEDHQAVAVPHHRIHGDGDPVVGGAGGGGAGEVPDDLLLFRVAAELAGQDGQGLLQGPRGAGGAQGGGQNGGGCHPPPLPPGGADLAGLGGGQKVLGDGRLLLGGKAEGV